MQTILALALTLLLGGCILQSPTANFSETQGKLLLGKAGGTYQSYELNDGVWSTDGTDVKLVAVDHHYELTDKNKVTKLLFVPLKGNWWVAQFSEEDKAYAYGLVDVEADQIYFHPLACTDIKKNVATKTFVTFVKDDCFLKSHSTTKDLIAMIGGAGENKLKLVLKK